MKPSWPSSASRSSRAAVIGSLGTLKGSLLSTQGAERAPGHVHAFPERVGAEQNRVPRLAKAAEQHVARRLALHQERPAGAERRPELRARPAGATRGW